MDAEIRLEALETSLCQCEPLNQVRNVLQNDPNLAQKLSELENSYQRLHDAQTRKAHLTSNYANQLYFQARWGDHLTDLAAHISRTTFDFGRISGNSPP
jgi:hypothetical protein